MRMLTIFMAAALAPERWADALDQAGGAVVPGDAGVSWWGGKPCVRIRYRRRGVNGKAQVC
jgi:hypothetical protein